MIIVLALWICLTLPFEIAFQPPYLVSLWSTSLEYVIDGIFAMDIAFNFRTTIKNMLTGDEIFDMRIIAMTYIKNRFIFDLLANIPFDAMMDSETQKT